MSRTVTVALALALVAGCSSAPPPKAKPAHPTEDDLAPKDVDPNAPPPELGKVVPAPAQPTPPPDTSKPGVVATILYVTEVEDKTRPSGMRPAAMVFSSDPESPYINDRPRTSRILKPLARDEMQSDLAELDAQGFSSLPWKEQASADPIPPDRAIYFFRDGKRTAVKKGELAGDDQKIAFTKIEKKLIYMARRTR